MALKTLMLYTESLQVKSRKGHRFTGVSKERPEIQRRGLLFWERPYKYYIYPRFHEAFQRLAQFLRYASLSVPASDIDSEDDAAPAPATAMMPDLEIALVGHNSFRFDFPFLLAECLRCGLGASAMARWLYVDTMDLLQATNCGECTKLQCAVRACSHPSCLRAHRALDDCIALEAVVEHLSARFGVSTLRLLRQFARRMDDAATVAQLGALIAQ